jgi:prolipoprotein diacylglyceryltransferase
VGAGGKVVPAGPGDYTATLQKFKDVYLPSYHSLDQVPHLAVKAPSFLPDWLFAYSYPHNVIGEGAHILDCNGPYCSQLPIPVFPTPFYETVTCLVLFFILWSLHKRLKIPGTLFAIYLILNGIERFLIEHIRVNTQYDILGLHPTQAELISAALVITGLVLYFRLKRKGQPPEKSSGNPDQPDLAVGTE